MRIRELNHCVYQTLYHIVWGTKFRRKILKTYVRKELYQAFKKTQRKNLDWYLHEVNAGDDHIHMMIEIPPKYAVSYVVQRLKSESSAILKKKFKFLTRLESIWETGFFVSTIGLNENVIKKYIERQDRADRGKDVTAEFS